MQVSVLALGLGLLVSFAAAAEVKPGAVVPWTTYEAETAKTNGTILAPDYQGQTPAREASGRSHVRLASKGDFIEFVAKNNAQGVVIRYSLPDGTGQARLSLKAGDHIAINVALTSTLSHLYGAYPFTNDASAGSPRNFWDEVRVMPGEIRAGDVVRLEIGAEGAESECLVDFLELETVELPLAMPSGALSVADYGATPNDDSDDRPALLAAIAAGKEQKKTVWIPAGRFVVKGPVEVSDVALQGAGMWHTTLVGVADYAVENRVSILGNGSNVTLSDFAVTGNLDYRNDSEPNDGIGGSFGTGSTLRNLWIEHTKAGVWITNSDGILIEGCRFRNTIADGLNLCVGMRNSTVRNCSSRGTGDDGFAMWPATYMPAKYAHGMNRFMNCTAQLTSLAQGFSLYGGESNSVSDCLAIDIPLGAGLFTSTTFPTELGFRGTTVFERNRVVRAGAREGAIGFVANRIDLVGLRFDDIEVIDSPNDAVRFMSVGGRALRDTSMSRIRITNAGTSGKGYGIASADDAVGSVRLQEVSVENAASGALRNVSPTFTIDGDKGIVDAKKHHPGAVAPGVAEKR
jgi:hypothetical protein